MKRYCPCHRRNCTSRPRPALQRGRMKCINTCECSGYAFPHRRGGGWCMEGKWTADQLRERMGQ